MNKFSRLRVGILCGPIHPKLGGPAAVVAAHLEVLSNYSDVTLFGVVDHTDRHEVSALYPDAFLFDRTYPKLWYRGQGLQASLAVKALQLDVLHAHMLWDYPVYAAWKVSRTLGLPFIITPHGTLAEAWRYSSPHKQLYRRFISDRMLEQASAVQLLSIAEEDAMKRLGLRMNSVVIPNGLPASHFIRNTSPNEAISRFPQLAGRRIVLFLGRLWPEKGLDILPRAWASATSADDSSLLVLAGPDYKGYQRTLISSIKEAGIADRTLVTGPLFGTIKDSLLAAADVFVLPSHSEGFSMSLLEAAAAGLPSIFTQECNFPQLALAGGGWEISRNKEDLSVAIRHALSLPKNDLLSIGNKARKWAGTHFSLENIGMDLLALYEKLMVSKLV